MGVDISLHRIKVEKIMLNRLLGPKFIGDLIQGDSTTHLLHTRRAYIVLVDPDCSALGKLGHSPEIRLWIRKEHIKHFMDIQYKLLKNACKLVKRGGIIAYSTCTFTLEENEGVVSKVIEEEGLEVVEPKLKLGDEGIGIKYARRFYPHKHDVQGFFYVLLKK